MRTTWQCLLLFVIEICVIVLFYLNINFTGEPPKQCLISIGNIATGVFSIVYFGPYEKKVENGLMRWHNA